jgi:hypothetical protein
MPRHPPYTLNSLKINFWAYQLTIDFHTLGFRLGAKSTILHLRIFTLSDCFTIYILFFTFYNLLSIYIMKYVTNHISYGFIFY